MTVSKKVETVIFSWYCQFFQIMQYNILNRSIKRNAKSYAYKTNVIVGKLLQIERRKDRRIIVGQLNPSNNIPKKSVFFVHSSFAARANVYTLNLSVNIKFHLMHVSAERSDGVSVRVTDVLACGSAFTANSTYFAHSRCLQSLAFIYRNNISPDENNCK